MRQRLNSLLKPRNKKLRDQKISIIEKDWRSFSKISNEDFDFLKELINWARCD